MQTTQREQEYASSRVEGDVCPVCKHPDPNEFLQAPDRFNGKEEQYQLVRCSRCSLVWIKNPPLPSRMGDHYGASYDQFITVRGEAAPEKSRGRAAVVESYISHGVLLDLGCSSGSFLQSLNVADWQLYGVEMSPEAAQRAGNNGRATIFVGDILDAPFAAGTFDVITGFDVLEHVYDPLKVLEKVYEWLKPGGIFYTQLPNIDSGEARLFKSYWYGLELPRHLYHFSPESFRYLARLAGLQEIAIEAHANSAMDHSVNYVWREALKSVGIARRAPSEARHSSLAWRILRKLLRWTLFRVIYRRACTKGAGESIHAVLRKPAVAPELQQSLAHADSSKT